MKILLTRDFWLGSSPRTSIYGIIKGIGVLLIPIINKEGFDIKTDWPFIIGALIMYASGRGQMDSSKKVKELANNSSLNN